MILISGVCDPNKYSGNYDNKINKLNINKISPI